MACQCSVLLQFGKAFLTGRRKWSNKMCHPNPTALVGNSLTGGLGVIEVLKVR